MSRSRLLHTITAPLESTYAVTRSEIACWRFVAKAVLRDASDTAYKVASGALISTTALSLGYLTMQLTTILGRRAPSIGSLSKRPPAEPGELSSSRETAEQKEEFKKRAVATAVRYKLLPAPNEPAA